MLEQERAMTMGGKGRNWSATRPGDLDGPVAQLARGAPAILLFCMPLACSGEVTSDRAGANQASGGSGAAVGGDAGATSASGGLAAVGGVLVAVGGDATGGVADITGGTSASGGLAAVGGDATGGVADITGGTSASGGLAAAGGTGGFPAPSSGGMAATAGKPSCGLFRGAGASATAITGGYDLAFVEGGQWSSGKSARLLVAQSSAGYDAFVMSPGAGAPANGTNGCSVALSGSVLIVTTGPDCRLRYAAPPEQGGECAYDDWQTIRLDLDPSGALSGTFAADGTDSATGAIALVGHGTVTRDQNPPALVIEPSGTRGRHVLLPWDEGFDAYWVDSAGHRDPVSCGDAEHGLTVTARAGSENVPISWTPLPAPDQPLGWIGTMAARARFDAAWNDYDWSTGGMVEARVAAGVRDFSGNLSAASVASQAILPLASLPLAALEGIAGLTTWGRVEWLENSPLCESGGCALVRPESNRCAGGGLAVWYNPSYNECVRVRVRLLSSEPCGADGGTPCGLRGADVRFSMRVAPVWPFAPWSTDGTSLTLPNEPIAGPDDLRWASPWQGLGYVCYDFWGGSGLWRRSEIGFAPGCDCAGAPPAGSYALLVESF
jgi:hypothetical protein